MKKVFIFISTVTFLVGCAQSSDHGGGSIGPRDNGPPGPGPLAENCLERSTQIDLSTVRTSMINKEFPFGDFVSITESNEIKLMSYNLENLFDTEHDVVDGVDKNDYQYLPIDHPLKSMCDPTSSYYRYCISTDWNPEVLDQKLNQLARVIKSQGSLPDVIGVQEVENAKVLGMLAEKLGYKKSNLAITVGPDARGIEVGVLFLDEKLKLVESKEHYVDPQGTRPTRNVLEVIFELKSQPGKFLGIYVNHWPSQGTPNSGWKRTSAAKTLKAAVDQRVLELGTENFHAVSLGDYNTLEPDRPHPFTSTVLDMNWANHFLNDAQWFYEEDPDIKRLPGRAKTALPEGTYFYRRNTVWNKFDRFFPSQNLMDGTGLEIVPNSFRIVTSPYTASLTKVKYEFDGKPGLILVPNRFNHSNQNACERGASDHFSVTVKLKLD